MSPFWLEKIRTNIERDKRVSSELEQQGWLVIRVWEHALKTRDGLRTQANELASRIGTIKREQRTA
jgi:G:T-mismatch repair DNA endonuclease (very short patch repair protein)